MIKKKDIIYRKKNQLSIYKRDDDKSGNYYGRCKIQGKDKIKSSGVKAKTKAIKVLEEWFDELQFKVKHNIVVHSLSVEKAVSRFITSIQKDTSITATTKNGDIKRIRKVLECKEFAKLDITNCTRQQIKDTYVQYVLNQKSNRGVTYRGATIKGYLRIISKLMNWAFDNGLRDKKIGKILTLITKDLKNQKTSRTHFTKEEYKHLLKVSRDSIAECRSKHHKFNRQKLHQFIIFMVGTGLRSESECMQLNWEDIEFVDRRNIISIDKSDTSVKHHDKCYLKINVVNSKVKTSRDCFGLSSAFNALRNLQKLYQINNIECKGNIWGVKDFRTSLNALLNEANLKQYMIGNQKVSRDSVSFRKTFMCFMFDRNLNAHDIAKQCGTSIAMIEQYYTAYKTADNLIEKIEESNQKYSEE